MFLQAWLQLQTLLVQLVILRLQLFYPNMAQIMKALVLEQMQTANPDLICNLRHSPSFEEVSEKCLMVSCQDCSNEAFRYRQYLMVSQQLLGHPNSYLRC